MKTGKKTSRAKAAAWLAVGFLPIGKVAKLGKMSAKGFNAVSKGSKAAKSIKKSRAKTSSTSKIKAKKNSEAKAKAAAKARANAKKKAEAKVKNNTGKKASGSTGTVWDDIKGTQPPREGTTIPKSFEINANMEPSTW
ncbi:hypothetical protein BTEBP_280015 [Brochothrix thermosphacta]|nr:hypothetical protein BTEBP_280015 [Brochothrix thermosphacta]